MAAAWILLTAGIPAASPEDGAAPTVEEIRHLNQVGRSAEAERAARASLKEAERLRGSESEEVGDILDELAIALRRGGKTNEPEALDVCQRALRIKKRIFGVESPRYAASLQNLGLLYFRRSDYERAQTNLTRALEIRKRVLGGNHPDVAKSLLALGSVQHELGNDTEALAMTERAVTIEESALGETNPERASGLNSLATIHYSMGDYSGAIPLFEQAIALWDRSPTPDPGVLATCYHNLGAVYDEIGDCSRAVGVLNHALTLREHAFGNDHPLVAATLTVLGSALQGTGDLRAARGRYARAVTILDKTPGNPDLGWVLSKLGWLYLDEGDLDRADETFRRALRNQESAIGTEHPLLWMCLRGLAKVAARRGETEAARGYYERTIRLLRKSSGDSHPDLGRTLAEYASFQLATRDSLLALHTALQAVGVNREHLRVTIRGIAERQALLYTSAVDTGMDVAFASLSGTLGNRSQEAVRPVWDAVVRSRAMVLDEVAERGRMVSSAGGVLEMAKRLEGARSRLANLLVREQSGQEAERIQAAVAVAREDVERAERELAAQSTSFRRGYDRAALGLDQVIAALPPGAALVSYVEHGEGRHRAFLVFVLGADRIPHVIPLAGADDIDGRIRRWRNLAGHAPEGGPRAMARAEAECRAAGEALRIRLWDPVTLFLAGSTMALVVPDGYLNLLNLSALPAPGAGYLIETPLIIHYLSAERDIVLRENLASHGSGLLAVGGPSFDVADGALALGPTAAETNDSAPNDRGEAAGCEGLRSVRFVALPQTEGEVDDVARCWGHPHDVTVLKGRSATERSVKELMPGRRVAHFATHAFFVEGPCDGGTGDPDRGQRGIGGIAVAGARSVPKPDLNPPVLAGLALAGANCRARAGPGQDDGILTSEEIASLDLSGLDWVVLSACDTGVGDVRSGEGVLGLRRAFEVAGAGTLILSLWPVEDESAREWMRVLYEGRFQKDLETAEAVREADRFQLRSLRARGRSTHPFYWGAFVAAGGWR